jgi:fumarate hydratase, class I
MSEPRIDTGLFPLAPDATPYRKLTSCTPATSPS